MNNLDSLEGLICEIKALVRKREYSSSLITKISMGSLVFSLFGFVASIFGLVSGEILSSIGLGMALGCLILLIGSMLYFANKIEPMLIELAMRQNNMLAKTVKDRINDGDE